jgi:hypothetical protein
MLEIFPYPATLDNAVHKRMNRSPDLTTGTFKQFRGACDQRIERRSDDPFGCDVIGERIQTCDLPSRHSTSVRVD